MAFLKREHECLETLVPGLAARLREHALQELERPGSPAIGLAKSAGAPALLVPRELGGTGASPRQAVLAHRALGSLSPSLAIALTMHNFSVATLVSYHLYGGEGKELLSAVAQQSLLLASGFAEGQSQAGILDTRLTAKPVPGGYALSGSKKPCSLSRSMDILTAGVGVQDGDERRRAVAIVPASFEGVEVVPFWKSEILAGAESDEVVLRDVFVPSDLMFFPEAGGALDEAEVGGFCWFGLLMSASYIGAASALVDRLLKSGKGSSAERVRLASALESQMCAVTGVAVDLEAGATPELLARTLSVRFHAQETIAASTTQAAELLGGMDFIQSFEVRYLLCAARALAFHPPSRTAIAASLDRHLEGGEFEFVG